MKKSLLFLFALFLSLGTMFGQLVWDNDKESILNVFENYDHEFWTEMNNESILKINGYITENELRKCANSLGSGSFSELDLSEARLDFDKAPAGLYYVNNGPIGLKYKKVTFPATVNGLDDNAFMGSATIEAGRSYFFWSSSQNNFSSSISTFRTYIYYIVCIFYHV